MRCVATRIITRLFAQCAGRVTEKKLKQTIKNYDENYTKYENRYFKFSIES